VLRLRDLDLLELGERLRFLRSAGEPEPTSEGERLRRRMGLTDRELLDLARRRRGGVRDRDLDSLGAGELAFSFGEADRDVCLGSLRLSLLGDHALSRPPSLRLRRGEGDRLDRRGGDLERLLEGERLRRLGGVRERSAEGERRARRGGGERVRLPEGERRSRELSRPRPLPRPPLGTYMSRSRRGGDLRLLSLVRERPLTSRSNLRRW
jgi:hypothetical protein